MNFLKGRNRAAGSCLVALVVFSGVLVVPVLAEGNVQKVEMSLTSYRVNCDGENGHAMSISNCLLETEFFGVEVKKDCFLITGSANTLTISGDGYSDDESGYMADLSMDGIILVDPGILGDHSDEDHSEPFSRSTTLYVPEFAYDSSKSSGDDPKHATIFLKCTPEECAEYVTDEIQWTAYAVGKTNYTSLSETLGGLEYSIDVQRGKPVFVKAEYSSRIVCWIIISGEGNASHFAPDEMNEFTEELKKVQDTVEPIDTKTGNNHFTETRLFAPAPGVPIKLNLAYKSVTSLPVRSLGVGWRHSYEWRLLTIPDCPAVLYTGSGDLYSFGENADSTYRPSNANNWTLEADGIGHKVELPGGQVCRFGTEGELTDIQDAWGNGVACSYGTNGCLEVVAHTNGRQLSFSNQWDSVLGDWRVSSIQMLNGASLEFDYNTDGQFTQIVEQVNNTRYISTYQYADGFLTNKVNGAGFEYAFEYEMGTNGMFNGKGTHLEVDGFYAHDVDYVSDDVTDVAYYARGIDQIHRYTYNSTGVLDTHYGPATSTQTVERRGTVYRYDPTGTDILETILFDLDANASWTQWMQYDDAHNLTNYSVAYNSTNPVHQLSLEYDPVWNLPTAIIDAEGHRTETTYTNGLPLVVKSFYSDTQSYDTHFGYTTNGWLRAVTNANDHVVNFGYDSAGNLTKIFAQLGPIATNTFNPLGFVQTTETLSESGASTGRITQFDRDAKGRVLQTTFADSLTSSAAYNAFGYLTNSVDRAGRTTDYTYAPTRQLTSVTRWLNEGGSNIPVRISYDLDEQMNQLKIIEPRGRYVESYQFDIQDRVTSVTNIEGQVMTLDYGVGSFVNQTTRFDGTTISNTYDQAGRLAIARISNNEQGTPNVEISYDYYPDGQQKSISDGTSTNTYAYDPLNRLTNTTSSVGNSMFDIQYSHDPIGNLTNSVVSIGGAQASATSYEYDTAERLTDLVSDREGATTQRFVYAYNPENGRVESISNSVSGITCTYEYDLMDRATNIVYKTGTGSLIQSLEYAYNAASMITEKKIVDDASCFVSHAYKYDTLDRLISEEKSNSVSLVYSVVYNYDLAGNRLSKTEDGIQTTYPLGMGNRLASTNMLYISGTADEPIGLDNRWGTLSVSNLTSGASTVPLVNGNSFFAELAATPDQTNTVKAAIRDRAGNTTYVTKDYWIETTSSTNTINHHAYDEAGCLTNLNGTTLDWDERYRLMSVDGASSSVEYTYDVLNRKTTRTEGTTVEHYVYNGQQVVADLDTTGNLLRTYIWGTGIDNLLSMTTYTNGGAQASATYYAIKDHQNTVIALTDSNGTVVESYEYDAYGCVLSVKDGSGNPQVSGLGFPVSSLCNRYTFQGREIDWTTGLIYFRARWYNPETGRWLSKDTVGVSGGLNLYEAFGNNPVNFVDPMGHVPSSTPVRNGIDYTVGNIGANYSGNETGGSFAIFAHGAGVDYISSRANQETINSSHIPVRTLATLIRNSEGYTEGQDILLVACASGKEGEDSFAQKLANELRVNVRAPTTNVAINVAPTDWKVKLKMKFKKDPTLALNDGDLYFEEGSGGKWETFKPE